MDNLERIIDRSAIWDLHIHTCKCPKSSGEFKNMKVSDYVDRLVEAFTSNSDLQMISFTDHNTFSIDVYEEFYRRNTGIKLIPGIEVSVDTTEVHYGQQKSVKHILFYFDDQNFDFATHGRKINGFLEKCDSVEFTKILEFLQNLNLAFVLSPHFLKQGKRGIQEEWTDPDAVERESPKYQDQMFCFWESSGKSAMMEAIKFVKEFLDDDKISIVSFSDAKNYQEVEDYLSNPPHYFHSLPSFGGLKLVGTDASRIVPSQISLSDDDKNKLIGTITVGENKIELSKRLNTIIGGRGSGKSILLDSIAHYLDRSKTKNRLTPDRRKFLEKRNIEVRSFSGEDLSKRHFHFDYFNQGYVANLFEKGDQDKFLQEYFKKEFGALKRFSKDEIIARQKELFDWHEPNLKSKDIKENLTNLSSNITSDAFDKKTVRVTKLNEKKTVEYKDYMSFKSDIIGKVPKEIREDKEVKQKIDELYRTVIDKTKIFNEEKIIPHNLQANIRNNYKDKVTAKNKKQKKKEKVIQLLKDNFAETAHIYSERVSIVNSILDLTLNYVSHEEDRQEFDGEKPKVFVFKTEFFVQNPLKSFINLLSDYIDKNKYKQSSKKSWNPNDIEAVLTTYCKHFEKVIQESKHEIGFCQKIYSLSFLDINIEKNIYYLVDEEEIKLREESPGTIANILMEYNVFKDTEVPLLIDQPEDSIDNRTIYDKLTRWFRNLKNQRQVVVATHDANIVVNADTENVVLSQYQKKTIIKSEDDSSPSIEGKAEEATVNEKGSTRDIQFVYSYGALEFEQNLSEVSHILEGGKEAIMRRMKKYG